MTKYTKEGKLQRKLNALPNICDKANNNLLYNGIDNENMQHMLVGTDLSYSY